MQYKSRIRVLDLIFIVAFSALLIGWFLDGARRDRDLLLWQKRAFDYEGQAEERQRLLNSKEQTITQQRLLLEEQAEQLAPANR